MIQAGGEESGERGGVEYHHRKEGGGYAWLIRAERKKKSSLISPRTAAAASFKKSGWVGEKEGKCVGVVFGGGPFHTWALKRGRAPVEKKGIMVLTNWGLGLLRLETSY